MKNRFERIYEENEQSLYTYLYYMTKNEEAARDLCQEVFLKIYLNLRKFKGGCSEKTWCMVIARNTFISWTKKKHFITVEINEEVLENHLKTPEQQLILKERGEFIRNILFMLKEEYRLVLLLRDHEGFSYKEIGQILGMSESKVKISIYRAREQYKKLFRGLGGECSGL